MKKNNPTGINYVTKHTCQNPYNFTLSYISEESTHVHFLGRFRKGIIQLCKIYRRAPNYSILGWICNFSTFSLNLFVNDSRGRSDRRTVALFMSSPKKFQNWSTDTFDLRHYGWSDQSVAFLRSTLWSRPEHPVARLPLHYLFSRILPRPMYTDEVDSNTSLLEPFRFPNNLR